MHEMKQIRSDPVAFQSALLRRGFFGHLEKILQADEQVRALMRRAESISIDMKKKEHGLLLTERNIVTQAKPTASRKEVEAEARMRVASMIGGLQRHMSGEFGRIDGDTKRLQTDLKGLLAEIPNLPAPDVPDGADEHDNVEVKRWGNLRAFSFVPREHADFAPALGLDFEGAAAMSGARFVAMRGQMARLHRALGQFMLDRQVENGFTEVAPPLLVREAALFGTGQLPKFADDLFRTTADEPGDARWLIPTAEVSLTNLVRERILDAGELPLRFTALTPCFRAEAGAAGRDTRGLIRQHQFDKVEMVSITHPDRSDAEQERMTACAEGVLEALDLPYRRMLLCAGDMGFTARRTFDLEVWLPGQNQYREISSCSTCGDFQARRMDARFRIAGEKGTRFVHTLNGSGLAVGRTLVAVLENGQEADGSVTLPAALLPYTGGMTRLEPRAA